MADNNDNSTDDRGDEVLARLGRLRQSLREERYPGQAWPEAQRRQHTRPHLRLWRVLVPVAAAAAAAAILLLVFRPAPVPVSPTGPDVAVNQNTLPPDATPALPPRERPLFYIHEDMDSYTILDVSSSVPLASFVSKNSIEQPWPVPLAPPEDPASRQSAGQLQ